MKSRVVSQQFGKVALGLVVSLFLLLVAVSASALPEPGSGIARLGLDDQKKDETQELRPEDLRHLSPEQRERILSEQRARVLSEQRDLKAEDLRHLSPEQRARVLSGQRDLKAEDLRHLSPEQRARILSEQRDRKKEEDPDRWLDEDEDREYLDDEQLRRSARERREMEALEPSRVENQYRLGYDSDLSEEVRQFGYEFFAHTTPKPTRFAVPDDRYVLGPGDRLRIRVWGAEVDAEFIGAVEPNGAINVPRIGIVPVAGTRFGNIEQVIRSEAEKYIQGVNISVSMEELRSVEVYVVGAVNRPGLHLVPAFSTVIDSLLAADGPRKAGSLRQVRVYRNGEFRQEIDLYSLLLAGDRSGDLLLENRDVIFVPRLGATAAVVGAAGQEGIFELAGEKTVGELLELAGGHLPHAFGGRIHLRRYLENREFVIKDIDTRRDPDWQQVAIKSGDLLELQSLKTEMPRAVKLEGHVWMPDVFRYQPGLSLQQVLADRALLKPGAVMDFALLHRYNQASGRYTVQRFPLEQVLQRLHDMELRPHDRIEILSRELLGIEERFTVRGAIWKPGEYPFFPGLTVADAIAVAGGERFGAELDRIELSRINIEDHRARTTVQRISLAEHGGLILQPFDYLMIPKVKDATITKTVEITGEVRYPGRYRISGNERVSDLISRAGGLLPDAYLFGVKYATEESREMQQEALDQLVRELEIRSQTVLHEQSQAAHQAEDLAAVEATRTTIEGLVQRLSTIEPDGRVSMVMADMDLFQGSAYDVELEHGDTLNIPKQPNFIAVTGSVYSAGSHVYVPGQTVGDYLERSGGPTRGADRKNMYVLRANGEVLAAARSGRFINSFTGQELMPGDMIVVPENLERVPYFRLVRDITDIVFKIATTAGVAIAILD